MADLGHDYTDDSDDTSRQTRVGHCKHDDTDTYVGRGRDNAWLGNVPVGERGWLGNPYPTDRYSRAESISKFRSDFEQRLATDAAFRDAVKQLHGQTLGCWCQRVSETEPACHAEVIAEWADRLHSPNSRDDLAQYTDSDAVTHEGAKLIIRRALAGRDYEERLSGAELAAACPGVSESTVRDLVGEVRREHSLAVYSRGSGYWHIQSPAELQEAVERIDEQIRTKEATKEELARAFNYRRYTE